MNDRDRSGMEKTMQISRSTLAEQMRTASDQERRRASFVVLGGLDVGAIIEIAEGTMVIGRDVECGLVLRDDGISRRHVEVERVATDTLRVRDLGSTNGTFVDGRRITEAVIRDGGKLLLGRRTVLKFALQDELEQDYQRKLYESSTRDGLTEVFNRKYFDDKLVADLSFAARHRIPLALLMLDIDHFKRVNDTHGHRTGDQILICVTRTIEDTIRTEDMLARYGGEEFVVIAQGTAAPGAIALAERIRARLFGEDIPVLSEQGGTMRVTVSIGVVTVPPGVVADAASVVSAADKNLYAAKESGRNRVVAGALS